MYFISDREGIDRHVLSPFYPTNVNNKEQVIYTSMNPWYPIGTVVFESSGDGSSSGSDEGEGEETGETVHNEQNETVSDSKPKTYSVNDINNFSNKLLIVGDNGPIIPYITAGTPWHFTYMKASTTCPFNVLGRGDITITTTIDGNTITTTYNVFVTKTKANIWTISIQAEHVSDNRLQGGFVTINLPSSANSNENIPITLYINDYKEIQTEPYVKIQYD